MQTITGAIASAQDNPNPTVRTLPSSIHKQTWMPQPKSTQECRYCQGVGWRPATTDEKQSMGYHTGLSVSVPCEYCVKQRIDQQAAELQDVSMLTEKEKAYRLDSIITKNRADTTTMVQACREMLDNKASMLTFWGTTGNAKSVALIAMVNEFLDRGIPAMYVPSYDLLNWIQDGLNAKGEIKNESMYARLERVKFMRMLAVDELQGIKVTDWRLEQLRNIVDRRWRGGQDGELYTLFAMNEDPASLEPRIWSRLRDGSNALSGVPVIENNDKDMRPLLRRKA